RVKGAGTALAKPDAAEAAKAQGGLLAEPAAAIALFGEKIKPAEAIDAKRLAQVIADLESPQFGTREQAARTLRDLGGRVAPALRTAAQESPVAESRRRAAALLDELKKTPYTAADLRALRAVEVLEWANSTEGRRLVETWSKGAPGARMTDAASEALGRVKK